MALLRLAPSRTPRLSGSHGQAGGRAPRRGMGKRDQAVFLTKAWLQRRRGPAHPLRRNGRAGRETPLLVHLAAPGSPPPLPTSASGALTIPPSSSLSARSRARAGISHRRGAGIYRLPASARGQAARRATEPPGEPPALTPRPIRHIPPTPSPPPRSDGVPPRPAGLPPRLSGGEEQPPPQPRRSEWVAMATE